MEAVSARQISGQSMARKGVGQVLGDRPRPHRTDNFLTDIEDALVATMIVSLSQGLHLYAAAADEHGWKSDLPDVLRVWRAGSILRMRLLDEIADRLEKRPGTSDPLSVGDIAGDVTAMLPAWRRTVGAAVAAGFPAPVLATSLAYVEALGTRALPTAMVQAQRDRFGAHGFARTDRVGVHHGPWVPPDREADA
jgi:6-phosphogluconate dehydrogenase